MIPKLIAALRNLEFEPTSEDVADILWLALQMQIYGSIETDQELVDPSEEFNRNAQTLPRDSHIPQNPLLYDDTQESSPTPESAGNLHLDSQNDGDVQRAHLSSQPFRSPGATALPGALALGSALRPFMHRFPSSKDLVLDEELTAHCIAEQDIWLPVLKPALTRWFEIALVVDESRSMALWKQTIAEFRLLLERQGAFRDVRTWGLVESTDEKTVCFRAGIGPTTGRRQTRNTNELLDPSRQRLILIVSDCVSRMWRNGAIMEILAKWGTSSSIVIVQVLPQWLWERSALGSAVEAHLHIPSPSTPNTRFDYEPLDYWIDKKKLKGGLPVPVVTLEPEIIYDWARAITGIEQVWISGYILDVRESKVEQDTQAKISLSAEQRLKRFQATASPTAQKLAKLLSATPISLPVVRLIQRTMLPSSQQSHVAEVFLGGLLEQLPTGSSVIDPDYVQYDFVYGVRELLLDSIPIGESVQVLRKVSDFVEDQYGLSFNFPALLEDPTPLQGISIGDRSRPFATVTAKVLRRIGGSYALLADRLEELPIDVPILTEQHKFYQEDLVQQRPVSSRPLRVFLCHSSQDKPKVRQLYHQLESENVAPWLDEENLLPGQNWDVEIRKAVCLSDIVIICLSKHFNTVGDRQREIKLALDVADEQPKGTIFLIPLRLELCEIPDRLRHLQWVDYFEEGGFLKLMQALKMRTQSLKVEAMPSVPPTDKTATDSSKTLVNEPQRENWVSKRPDSYIGIARDSTFQERPHEFEELEKLLFPARKDFPPYLHIHCVGLVGMAGQGKTRLALEIAYRYQKRFPGGVYWMTATGTDRDKWIEHFAELAFNTNYLPADDNRTSEKENKRNRACHICYYLASHDDALLILDNVEEPNLISTVIIGLGGQEPQCTILYTSRYSFPPRSIPGVVLHSVEKLPETAAIALLLEKRKTSEGFDGEMDAARSICIYVDRLPLALMLLRSLLEDPYETVSKLEQRLKERGAMETTREEGNSKSPLFSAFELSWDKLQSEAARRVLKLASCFPEATSIPLWLLGLAAGLGENSDELDRAYKQLRQWSLVEPHSEIAVRLRPVIREFAHLLIEYDRDGEVWLTEVRQRLLTEFTDLNKLENRARRVGYWQCLDMVHVASVLARELQMDQALDRVERLMTREGSLLGDEQLWPWMIPGLFYQQLYNRSFENGYLLTGDRSPDRWLKQDGRVGDEDEDPFLLQNLTGHESDINCIAFSHDGERVITGLNNWAGTVRVWSATDGRLLSMWEEHHGAVIEVMFLPDNNNVVIGTATGMVYTWDIQQNKLKRELLPAEGHNVTHMAFASSSTGVKMVADVSGKTVCVRSVESGKTLATFAGHERDVTCVAFSPDGSRLVTGSSDRFARIWDTGSRQIVRRLEEHDQGVTSVAFSSDGRSIVTGADDSIARIWDVASGQCISMLEGHEKPIKIVTFSPDGTRIAAGSTNGIVLLWDSASGKILQHLHGHMDRLISMAFSPDGTKLATGARDRIVRIWNASGVDKVDINVEARCELTCVAFSSDGSRLVTASNSETVHIWDVAKRQVLSSLSEPIVSIKHAAFSSDSTRVAIGLSGGTVYIWDCDKRTIQKILNGHTGDITSLMFSPDGTMLATASTDATARLWDLASGRAVVLEGHLSEVTSVAFSPNGDKVITGSKDGTARIWNVAGQSTPILLKDRFRDITSVCVSHNSTKVATGSSDGTVRVWQYDKITPLMHLKRGGSEITTLCFSPDDRLLIMGNKDGEITLWQMDQQEREQPIGMYTTGYGVGAIHWQNPQRLVLADMGGPQHRPHFYHLVLEGTW